MADRTLRLGVAGLGRGFALMLPTLVADARVKIAAVADPRPEARARAAQEFGARTYDTIEALCRDPDVDAIYIATPHQFHAAHATAAASAGKHMLIEKPIALTLAECGAMIEAAAKARVHIVVGHSHSFDAPIGETRRLVASGKYGALRLVTAFNYTDFMYRPRRPEELDTGQGGGVIFNQGAHQVDMVRLLAGGLTETVRASAQNLDPARKAEGAYTAFLSFAGGAAATITYNGYAHFDSDEFCDWVAESGMRKSADRYGEARRMLAGVTDAAAEAALKADQGYGGKLAPPASPREAERLHPHFGVVIASCEHADLRPLANGVMVYGDEVRALSSLEKPQVPRREVIDELHAAVFGGQAPVHSGAWGMATLEVCLAIVQSAREGREVRLAHQVALPQSIR